MQVWWPSQVLPCPRRRPCRPQLLLLLFSLALSTISLLNSRPGYQRVTTVIPAVVPTAATTVAPAAPQTAPSVAIPAASSAAALVAVPAAASAAVPAAAPAAAPAAVSVAASVKAVSPVTETKEGASPPSSLSAGPAANRTVRERHQEELGMSPPTTPTHHQTVMLERMRERSARMRRACEANPKYKAPAISTNVFYDRSHSMVWCPVFKAGSTNWLRLLCQTHGLGEKCPIEALRRHLGSIHRHWKVPAPVRHRFLVVRHPFERLLSAFRDKIENHGSRPGQPYWKKAARMVRLQRRRDYVPLPVSEAELSGPPPPPPPSHPPPLTFPEFLRSVARQDVGDEHWKPYFALCTPCNVGFDLVGKFETLQEDNRYIAHRLGLNGPVELLLPQLGNQNRRGQTGDRTQQYFSQVTRAELTRVYRTFKMDFIMFNYTVDEYLQYVKPDDGDGDDDADSMINIVL